MLKWQVDVRLMGVWDLQKTAITLGGILTLASELTIISKQEGVALEGVCFIGSIPGLGKVDDLRLLRAEEINKNVLLRVLYAVNGVSRIYMAASVEQVSSVYRLWPGLDDKRYQYGTYFFLQAFCRDGGKMLPLGLKGPVLDRANEYIDVKAPMKKVVAVHLKNNERLSGCSNANFKEWHAFFVECGDQFQDFTFFLIGNEKMPESFLKLENVVVVQKDDLDFVAHLAIIERAAFFMGMSSGPCNMALLNQKPCVIFKNPDHDVEEMRQELGARERFDFCTQEQKMVRRFETKELLMREFLLLNSL